MSEKSSYEKPRSSHSKGAKSFGKSFSRGFQEGSGGKHFEGKSKKGTVRGGSSASLYKRKQPQ